MDFGWFEKCYDMLWLFLQQSQLKIRVEALQVVAYTKYQSRHICEVVFYWFLPSA